MGSSKIWKITFTNGESDILNTDQVRKRLSHIKVGTKIELIKEM